MYSYFCTTPRVVEFASRTDMDRAVEKYDGYEVHGRKLELTTPRDQNQEEDPSHALDPVTAADHDLSLGLDQDQEIVSAQKKDEDDLDRDLNLGLRSKLTEW